MQPTRTTLPATMPRNPTSLQVVQASHAAPIGRVKPLPPADSIGSSVRALNTILQQMAGKDAITALRAGDACMHIDKALWTPSWEGARNFRDHFLLSLARQTRDEWRRDVNEIVSTTREKDRPEMIAKALEERLRITFEFTFKFLTPRHVCFLSDALMMAFEPDIKPKDFTKELAEAAPKARGAYKDVLDAVILGASGMHRFDPERCLATTGASGFAY
jgi:hypothetical protein